MAQQLTDRGWTAHGLPAQIRVQQREARTLEAMDHMDGCVLGLSG